MSAYIIRRLLAMIPTLFGIMLITFAIVQFSPGGPIETIAARLQGMDNSSRLSGGNSSETRANTSSQSETTSSYRGAQGLDPDLIKELEKQFGFDKPVYERFFLMVWNYIRFDFGTSYFRDIPVIELVKEKLPVSISLGLWLTLISYVVAVPLGIRKAVRDGSRFDIISSSFLVFGYAIPNFLFAVLLIVLFAGGTFFDWFPLRGLVSDNWDQMSVFGKITDYFWHLVLPVFAMAVSAFTIITFLTKNSFLDEIKKQYVLTAKAKGLTEHRVLYGHVFRNAMLIVISSFPAVFIRSFFTGALLIETIFSLDGLGLLSYDAIIDRDYAVVFATTYIFALLALATNLISDLTYVWIDPRIDFETREA